MIHGLPNGFTADRIGHPSSDWTNGCIAVKRRDREIWRLETMDGHSHSAPVISKPADLVVFDRKAKL